MIKARKDFRNDALLMETPHCKFQYLELAFLIYLLAATFEKPRRIGLKYFLMILALI
jgi:hypothetical protein